jgi:hypothetical protein
LVINKIKYYETNHYQNVHSSLWDFNEGISAASFCHKAAALVPDIFCNFYFVKNHKIANNSATTEARENISADLESSEFKKIGVHLSKFEKH